VFGYAEAAGGRRLLVMLLAVLATSKLSKQVGLVAIKQIRSDLLSCLHRGFVIIADVCSLQRPALRVFYSPPDGL
jgi:hypothetical protein